MRLILTAIMIFVCWRWGDIKNWKKYYPTILYMIVNNLLYVFFTGGDYFLWKFEKDFFVLNETFGFLVITFLAFPCSVMLFLANYPHPWKKQILYIIMWTAFFQAIETIMILFGRITYHHGWNLWWSLAFNFITFPMLRFHYVNPIATWFISFIIAALLIIYFDVPLPEH